MKRCPSCNRTYTDIALNYCLEDGTPLVSDTSPEFDSQATVSYPGPRDTSEPPPTEIYRPDTAPNRAPQIAQPPQWSPMPSAPSFSPPPPVPRQKSNAVWWVLGGLAAVGIIGIGLLIMLVALASMSSVSNENANRGNTNSRTGNRNTTANVDNTNRPNTNTSRLPTSLTDN